MRKRIRKWAALMMAMVLTGLPGAFAAVPTVSLLEGEILQEQEDGSFLLQSLSMGEVLVKVSEATGWEGMDRAVPGAYVTVAYNGIMTKSLPPQVTADRVSCYRLEGTVLEADLPEGIILVDSLGLGPVLVRLPQLDVQPGTGDFVLVYYTGVMAMSLPGQVTGQKVSVLVAEEGTVTEMGEGFFLTEGGNGTVRVNTDSLSRIPEPLETGDAVKVYYSGIMTRSIPPQMYALAVLRVLDE